MSARPSKEVVSLVAYRRLRARSYRSRYSAEIKSFISQFVSRHLRIDFQALSRSYIDRQVQNLETAWDYIELRDSLELALHEVVGELLLSELKEQAWYDSRFIGIDELVEMCLSRIILGEESGAFVATQGPL